MPCESSLLYGNSGSAGDSRALNDDYNAAHDEERSFASNRPVAVGARGGEASLGRRMQERMFAPLVDTKTLAEHLADPAFVLVDCPYNLAEEAWGEREYCAS